MKKFKRHKDYEFLIKIFAYSNCKAQKDTDARWTKKNNVSYFGYKNHANCDAKSKLILKR